MEKLEYVEYSSSNAVESVKNKWENDVKKQEYLISIILEKRGENDVHWPKWKDLPCLGEWTLSPLCLGKRDYKGSNVA